MKYRVAICLAAAGAIAVACSPTPVERTPAPPPPRPEPVQPSPPPAPPTLPPALDRAELLRAVAAAASAVAAATAYPDEAAALAGRSFAVTLPFGCQAAPGEPPEAALDSKRQLIRLRVTPNTWTDDLWARQLAGAEDVEALEGFWIRWPWMFEAACPAAPASAEADVPAAESVALLEAFPKGGSRLARREGRDYTATLKLDAATSAPPGGFRLVVEGRIASPSDGRPVRCRPFVNRPPLCAVLVRIDGVRFETADGQSVAEWGY